MSLNALSRRCGPPDDTETDDFTEILQELEEIDDDAELFGIDFVKVNDLEAAVHWNIRNFPTVAYFRKGIPTFYEGTTGLLFLYSTAWDLTDAERVLRWLTSHDMIEIKDEIEGVNRRMLEKLLEDNDYVAVLFLADDLEAGQNASLEVLDNLEDIDLEVSELDLLFVKLSDPKFAKRYGLTELPSLIYFRRRFPNVFRGKTPDLNWFMLNVMTVAMVFLLYTIFIKCCLQPPPPPPPTK
ncbi:hypothetical protein LAZ67_13002331 [Cordylochernes scorpioides]|uniref:Thioredoxin domain-containing protein n=1 Tax=Cordylochernes scorpioides TaxID=51811 RepID=A0ABY6L9A2_9ARAC|nr:hypothetical protein LAZ67_13002331 [Cordylochernes scorpioides]